MMNNDRKSGNASQSAYVVSSGTRWVGSGATPCSSFCAADEPCSITADGRCAVDPSPNARLIAAAPEMLAILEEILPDIECRCGEAYTGRGLHESNSLCHLVDEVKAIIAKAKGEEVDHE